jgi:hypothetical protein
MHCIANLHRVDNMTAFRLVGLHSDYIMPAFSQLRLMRSGREIVNAYDEMRYALDGDVICTIEGGGERDILSLARMHNWRSIIEIAIILFNLILTQYGPAADCC